MKSDKLFIVLKNNNNLMEEFKPKKIVFTKEFKVCKSFFSKLRGLMFSKPKMLVFDFDREEYRSLHMFFVFFPIDLVFLDENKTVIEIKKDFKPFTIYNSKTKAQYVIEIPAGRIQDKVNIGDKVRI